MLNAVSYMCYAEGHYAECRYAECHYAECRGAVELRQCYQKISSSLKNELHCLPLASIFRLL